MMKKAMVYFGPQIKAASTLLAETDCRELATYDTAVLVEAEEDALESLRQSGFHVREQSRPERTNVRGFALETPSEPVFEDMLETAPTSESSHFILQWIGPLHPAWLEQLEALGATLHESLSDDRYLITVPQQGLPQIQTMPAVESIIPYPPALKIAPSLLDVALQAFMAAEEPMLSADALPDPVPTVLKEMNVRCAIALFHDEDRDSVAMAAQDLGAEIIEERPRVLVMKIERQLLPQLARMAEVRSVHLCGPVVLHNPVAAEIVRVPAVQNLGLDGSGEIVAVADTGLDRGVDDGTLLADFRGRIVAIQALGRDGDASDLDNHGTHVAGSIVGTGASSNGKIQGIAPGAGLIFQSMMKADRNLGIPADLGTELFGAAQSAGAAIHNNSWGEALTNGAYGPRAQEVDQFAFSNRDFLILFAAGNDGRFRVTTPGTAKNVLTVGASKSRRLLPDNVTFPTNPPSSLHFAEEADDPAEMWEGSSGGPVEESRRKPDVVAPGTFILSTRSSVSTANRGPDGLAGTGDEIGFSHPQAVGKGLPGAPFFGAGDKNTPSAPPDSGPAVSDNYFYESGTSMATAIVSGCCALIRQFLRSVGHTPSAALLKALIVSGAQNLGPGVPDDKQGWGRVDLLSSLVSNNGAAVQFDDRLDHALSAGEIHSYRFSAVNSNDPVVVTLIWRDPEGAKIQNELRLAVNSPHNLEFSSEPEGLVLNNVQKVIILQPESGDYFVRVEAIRISRGVPELAGLRQDYALVVSNANRLEKILAP